MSYVFATLSWEATTVRKSLGCKYKEKKTTMNELNDPLTVILGDLP